MTCETCRHFVKGECHRFPPVVVADNGIGGETLHYASVWPAAGKDESCGEHREEP